LPKYTINTLNKISTIKKEIYGHFAEHLGRCIYGGIFVGENSPIPNTKGMRNDVIKALRDISIPVLRWPGGCFADEYHWKDGIGPLSNRKKMINTHWGGITEDNSFGTHEFLELCEQLGCEPYINGNMGSGTVLEMQEWVEYMTSDNVSPMTDLRKQNGREKPWKIKYFGLGNETWGCGGHMTAEYSANEHRRYQTYVRNYGDNQIYKIACGANDENYHWTETLMKNAANFMHGLSLHSYTITHNWQKKGSATEFTRDEYYKTLRKTLRMDALVENHSKIMDRYDPERRIGMIVDEWGTWFDVEPGTNPGFLYQQNTMRDALVAGINLNIFNKHSARVHMANIAQTVNVLQAVILTEDDKMILTPTYHVFEMYKHHQGAALLDSFIEIKQIGTEANKMPNLHESCSIDEDGFINITICNLSDDEGYEIDTEIVGTKVTMMTGYILQGAIDAHNDFDNPNTIQKADFKDGAITERGIKLNIPPCSIISLRLS